MSDTKTSAYPGLLGMRCQEPGVPNAESVGYAPKPPIDGIVVGWSGDRIVCLKVDGMIVEVDPRKATFKYVTIGAVATTGSETGL